MTSNDEGLLSHWTPRPSSIRKEKKSSSDRPSLGGGRRKKASKTNKVAGMTSRAHAGSWTNSGRKVTMKDGSKKTVWVNAAKERSVRKMVTRRGEKTAIYVKLTGK